MLTGDNDPELFFRCIRAGADGYLVKPCDHICRELRRMIDDEPGTLPEGEGLGDSGRATLVSHGVNEGLLELVDDWTKRGMPSLQDLAEARGCSNMAISNSLGRVKRKLRLETTYALASYLTALMMMDGRFHAMRTSEWQRRLEEN